jgi:glutamate--cysteine ligase
MNDYMASVGTHGTQMMRRTCTVQVNLDFGSEADMVQKFRVALALQPVATALFANSPFFEGKPNGHKSWRSRIWRSLDSSRTGMLPFAFEPGFGFEAYVQYALDVPMYFVYRDGRYINALGQSFRDFMAGRLPALPGEVPTLSDWADHLTTIFPEARLKKFIEMRGADGGPWRRLCALPALWVGLIYDQSSLDAAWDLAKGWDAETREALRVSASVEGLAGGAGSVKMLDLARELVALVAVGLIVAAVPRWSRAKLVVAAATLHVGLLAASLLGVFVSMLVRDTSWLEYVEPDDSRVARLQSPHPAVREHVARCMADTGVPAGAVPLLERLAADDTEPDVARAAQRALARPPP